MAGAIRLHTTTISNVQGSIEEVATKFDTPQETGIIIVTETPTPPVDLALTTRHAPPGPSIAAIQVILLSTSIHNAFACTTTAT